MQPLTASTMHVKRYLGIYAALKLIPEHVMTEARERAVSAPPSRLGAAAVILVWLAFSGLVLYGVFRQGA